MPTIIKVKLQGLSPLIQSRSHEQPKLNRELPDAYEQRTWFLKSHVAGGYEKTPIDFSVRDDWESCQVVIPAISFKRSLEEVAKYLSVQIPGKGKATYTKHFESGVQCHDDIAIGFANGKSFEPLLAGSLKAQRIFVNADGVRGSGKRVHRLFPVIPSGWIGYTAFQIWDDLITPEVFLEHLIMAGTLIGVGSFRVRKGGSCGRFLPSIEATKVLTVEEVIKNAAGN